MAHPSKCHCCLLDLPADQSVPYMNMLRTFLVDNTRDVSFLAAYLEINQTSDLKEWDSDTSGELNICRMCVIQLENAYTFRELCRQTEKWRTALGLKSVKREKSVERPKILVKQSQRKKGGIKCPHCPKISKFGVQAAAHELMHQSRKLKTGAYRCTVCTKVYLDPKNFRVHFRMCHLGRIVSEKNFRIPASTVHSKVTRKNNKPSTATVTQWDNNNDDHLEKRYKCQQCPKQFSSIKGFREHVRVIHEKIMLKCKGCPKTFKYNSCLAVHKKKCRGTV